MGESSLHAKDTSGSMASPRGHGLEGRKPGTRYAVPGSLGYPHGAKGIIPQLEARAQDRKTLGLDS